MITFHREKIQKSKEAELDTQASFFDLDLKNIDSYRPEKSLAEIKKVFTRLDTNSTPIENHCFDVISPILNDHQSFSIYLHLYRMSKNNTLEINIDSLCSVLDLTRKELLLTFAILEENLLIQLSCTREHTVTIKLNRNWNDSL